MSLPLAALGLSAFADAEIGIAQDAANQQGLSIRVPFLAGKTEAAPTLPLATGSSGVKVPLRSLVAQDWEFRTTPYAEQPLGKSRWPITLHQLLSKRHHSF